MKKIFTLFALLFPLFLNAGTVTVTGTGSGTVDINSSTPVSAVPVNAGGTGRTSSTAYAVIAGGTSSTSAHQSVASVGTSGQVLTSNGAGALPSFQDPQAAWSSFTPTVDCGGDTEPVYSTNTGRKNKLNKIVFEKVYLTGDGGAEGSGSTTQMTVALNETIGANQPAGRFPCGSITNSVTTNTLWCTLTASGTTVALEKESSGTYSNVVCNDQNNTTRIIRLDFNFEID